MDVTSWKLRAKRLKSEIHSLYIAARDPRTPWYVKALAVFIIGYVTTFTTSFSELAFRTRNYPPHKNDAQRSFTGM